MNPIFLEALFSVDRSSEIPEGHDIYGWLVGSWKVRAVDYGDHGEKQEREGEWHFARVLEGRAIQDVYIVPVRQKRSANIPVEGNRYGTTLRIFDRESKTWRIRWNNPVRDVENHLTGRKVGDEILQEGKDVHGEWIRWWFRDITPDSFLWIGEQSVDEGKT